MVLERKYGVGIEAEGFILKVDSQEAVEEIDGLPAVEWVMNEVKRKYKTEMDNVDGEEASIHLEVKTGVHKDEDAAVAEVMDLHGMVNEILEPRGLRYVFQPVVQKSFEFMAASTDPDHRSHALIKDWGRTNPGLLYSTAIAVLQVNDSRMFEGASDEQALEIMLQLMNSYTAEVRAKFHGMNTDMKSHMDMTREEHLWALLPTVKAKRFQAAGFTPEEAFMPPHFETVIDMQKWMLAHSIPGRITHSVQAMKNWLHKYRPEHNRWHKGAKSKNEHGFWVKSKRGKGGLWVVESRHTDCLADNAEDMERLVKPVTAHWHETLGLRRAAA